MIFCRVKRRVLFVGGTMWLETSLLRTIADQFNLSLQQCSCSEWNFFRYFDRSSYLGSVASNTDSCLSGYWLHPDPSTVPHYFSGLAHNGDLASRHSCLPASGMDSYDNPGFWGGTYSEKGRPSRVASCQWMWLRLAHAILTLSCCFWVSEEAACVAF